MLRIFRNIVFGVGVAALSGCAAQSSAAPPHASSASAGNAKAASASASALGQAQGFVADVVAGGAGIEQRHSLVMVGPALNAEIKALDSSFEHLGNAVELMNPDGQGAALGRMCSAQTCAKFLHAKGLRDVLQPFGKAEYRSADATQRKIMLERSPDHFPEDTPATVAVAGEHVLGIYVIADSMIWIELLSKSYQVTFSPDPDAPSTPEARTIEATRCLNLESVQLDQPEDVFSANTTAQDMASGVARLVEGLDGLLLEAKNQATGGWSVRFAFDKSGLTKATAPTKAGVDPAILERLGDKVAGHSPFSRGPELSFLLELSLRPCAK